MHLNVKIKCIIPVNSILDHCPPRERGTFMEYDECPMDVLSRWDTSRGVMVLVLQPPPPNYQPKKTRRKRPNDAERPLAKVQTKSPKSSVDTRHVPSDFENSNFSFEINIADGVKAGRSPQLLEIIPPGLKAIIHKVWPSVTEVGFVPSTTHSSTSYIKLPQNPGLLPRHCILANMEGIVTITPHENAKVVVDGTAIKETFMLDNAASIVLGQDTTLVFVDEHNPDGPEVQGISPAELKSKISDAGVAIAQSVHSNVPIKAINQLRPGKPRPDERSDEPQILEYTEEPGGFGRRQWISNPPGAPGYTHISNIGSPQVAANNAQLQQQPPLRRPSYKSLLPAQIDYTIRLEDTLLTGIFQAAEEKPLQSRF